MIAHHPQDELLLARAAGRLDAGPALLVDVHLERCAACRAQLRVFDAVGGALLEHAEPALLAPQALAQTLARIDAEAPDAGAPRAQRVEPQRRAALPPGVAWPASLRDCAISGWRWMGPGMRWARVTLPEAPATSLFLLRIGPGRSLPRHGHRGLEITQVLCGAFDDGRAVFGPGDFDAVDDDVRHQPVVRPGSVCVCLASVGGKLAFEGRVASLIGGWIGM